MLAEPPPWWGIPSTREKALGKTWDTLEEICLPAGLGAAQDSPRKAGRSGRAPQHQISGVTYHYIIRGRCNCMSKVAVNQEGSLSSSLSNEKLTWMAQTSADRWCLCETPRTMCKLTPIDSQKCRPKAVESYREKKKARRMSLSEHSFVCWEPVRWFCGCQWWL